MHNARKERPVLPKRPYKQKTVNGDSEQISGGLRYLMHSYVVFVVVIVIYLLVFSPWWLSRLVW